MNLQKKKMLKYFTYAVGLFLMIILLSFNEITFTYVNQYIALSIKERIFYTILDIFLIVCIFLCFVRPVMISLFMISCIVLIRHNFILIVFLSVFAFIAMELLVRLLYPGVFPTYQPNKTLKNLTNIYEYNNIVFYGLKKNIYSKKLYYRSNYSFMLNTDSNGFRIGHTVKDKANILILGDSLTFGFVNDDETYPAYLQKTLSKKVNVYNAGVPGWGFAEYCLQYEYYAPKLEPKIVV